MKNESRFFLNDHVNGNGSSNSFKTGSMNSQSSKLNNTELFDPKKLVSLFLRHIWLIMFCALLSVAATYYIVNYYMLPVYESSGTMLISSSDESLPGTGGSGAGGGVSKIIALSFSSNYDDPVQNAIYLFESRELAHIVADSLLEARKIDRSHPYPSLWVDYPDDSTLVPDENVMNRIRSGLVVETVQSKSSNLMGSNLLKISYQSYSPFEAAKVVNLTTEAFQEKSLDQKKNTASKALSFLGEKKAELRAQLDNAEDRLVGFQNENKLVAIDAQAGNSVNSLSQIQAERENLKIQLESINSSIKNYERQMEAIKPGMSDQYSKALGPTIANYQQRLAELRTQRFVILSNNPQLKNNPNSEPELRKLNQQISELESEINSLSEGLVNENDGYIDISGSGDGNLAQELSNIQRNLIELEIQKNQTQSQIEVLNQRIEKTESFLDTYPDKQVKLARLETEVQRSKQLLDNILTQEAEVGLWQQTQNSSGSIVDEAKPKFAPVKPNKILWLCFGGMIGIVLPIGFLIIKDSLSSTLNSYEQLKSYPYPLLPVIYDHSLLKTNGWILNKDNDDKLPNISKNVVFYHNTETPIAESYRKIVGQVLYSNPDSMPDSFVITSSGQGEGKTTFTANLGAAFAEVDKKVLIIDCDFRRPAIHKLFSMDNSLGVKEVLFDDGKLSEAIKNTGIPDLHVLTTGSKPVSSAKLLASNKFKEMVKIIKPNYDIILFDTPPHGLVSDVVSLLSLADMLIVIAKFGETHEKSLKHTLEELEINKRSNINLVLTCYKPSKSYDSLDTKGMHKYMYQKYYDYQKG